MVLHSLIKILKANLFSEIDIQFWNNRKSLEGLSVRSVFFNVFQSTVVLLYVLDNDTNTVVRISCFVGLGIEIWKIHKVSISIYHGKPPF
jgi:Cleft lip and palate transmembrane protein 1 (CLPTM1)